MNKEIETLAKAFLKSECDPIGYARDMEIDMSELSSEEVYEIVDSHIEEYKSQVFTRSNSTREDFDVAFEKAENEAYDNC